MKPEPPPSPSVPFPSLEQFQYKLFRKSLAYMLAIGLPFILGYTFFYHFVFDAASSAIGWRLLAAFWALCLFVSCANKNYQGYSSWAVVIFGLACYTSVVQHMLSIAPLADALPHSVTMSTVFIIGIMAISPMLKKAQTVIGATLITIMPFLLIALNFPEEKIDYTLVARQLTCAIFAIFLGLKLKADSIESYHMHFKLHQAGQRDHLTQLLNRSGFHLTLSPHIERAKRDGSSIGMMMIDIDHFKVVNDKYGHDIGDLAIRHVANQVIKSSRPYDISSRFGGEEFLIALPNISPEELIIIAERIRSEIEQSMFKTPDDTINLTVSIGVSSFKPQNENTLLEGAIKIADSLLYQAKRNGRNRVCSALDIAPAEFSSLSP